MEISRRGRRQRAVVNERSTRRPPRRNLRRTRTEGNADVVGQPVATQLLEAVDKAVETRWEAARQRAAAIDGAGRDERVEQLTNSIRTELGLAGAAAGGAAAVPGVGLATSSAAFMVELGWSTLRLADLILTIAAIHGHDRATVDERRMWVLSILTYRDGAAKVVTELAEELAGPRNGARVVSRRSMQRMNAIMGRTIVSRYGARRGIAAIGRAVPFGVGAALGYGINARTVSTTAKHAHGFFTNFPITLDAIDVDGTRVAGAIETQIIDASDR